MMGLLEEVALGKDASRTRADMHHVTLSIAEEPFSVVEVTNNSGHNIYEVEVLIKDKSDNSIAAVSDTVETAIRAGTSHRFGIKLTRTRPSPDNIFCIVQFSDVYGTRWNKYLMGRLETVGPDPSPSRGRPPGRMFGAWPQRIRSRLGRP